MNDVYVALCSALLFLIINFCESKFIKKDKRVIQSYLKETMYVFISVYIGIFLFERLVNSSLFDFQKSSPPAFVDAPEF